MRSMGIARGQTRQVERLISEKKDLSDEKLARLITNRGVARREGEAPGGKAGLISILRKRAPFVPRIDEEMPLREEDKALLAGEGMKYVIGFDRRDIPAVIAEILRIRRSLTDFNELCGYFKIESSLTGCAGAEIKFSGYRQIDNRRENAGQARICVKYNGGLIFGKPPVYPEGVSAFLW